MHIESSPPPFQQMMGEFHARLAEPSCEYQLHACHDMSTMQTVDDIYAVGRAAGNTDISGGGLQSSSDAHPAPDSTYRWPPVDEESGRAVEKQLRESVSIYDNGGIFGKFEKAWKKCHGLPESHTLLHNSGTNALQALYFAIQVQPGDEVCCSTHLIPSWLLTKVVARSYFPFTASTQPALRRCNLVLSQFSATLQIMATYLQKLYRLL